MPTRDSSPSSATRGASRRTILVPVVVFLVLAAACAPQEYHRQTSAVYLSAAGCLQVNQDYLYTTGGYALGTSPSAPATRPSHLGGREGPRRSTPTGSRTDPYLGRGFEGAVAFEVAERLGFADDDVRFVPVAFTESSAPGDKDFDFVLQQIPYLADRARAWTSARVTTTWTRRSCRSEVADRGATSLDELRHAAGCAERHREPRVHRGHDPAEQAPDRLRRPRSGGARAGGRDGPRHRGGSADRVAPRGTDPRRRARPPAPRRRLAGRYVMAFERGPDRGLCEPRPPGR